jgi:hypothetical protein
MLRCSLERTNHIDLNKAQGDFFVRLPSREQPIEKILAHLEEKGIDARAGPFVDAVA